MIGTPPFFSETPGLFRREENLLRPDYTENAMKQPTAFSSFTTKSVDEVISSLNTATTGLSQREAQSRAQSHGTNELSARQTHWYDILIRQFESPFLYMLFGAAMLSFFLGEKIDALMILLFVGINAVLGFYQEYRSEKTLRLLKQYVVAKTKAFRDGREEAIRSADLVPGDIITLKPGDIIPADIRFIKTENMVVDESLLSGESVAVGKTADKIAAETTQIYKAKNIGFSGTTVLSGEGIGAVIGTGKNTAIGGIASLAVETKHESSFEKGISRLSNFILKLIVATLLLLVLLNIALKGSGTDIGTLIIFAIALAISVIPEGLPVVTTFSFSKGALRLAKNKVVVKRLSAIEDLGSIEVLCTDKTGTITENKLSVSSVYPEKGESVLYAALATSLLSKGAKHTDSFDIAVMNALTAAEKKEFALYDRLDEAPFDPKRRRNSVIVKKNSKHHIVVRGAFESILPLCKGTTAAERATLHKWVEHEGKQGRRVIAIARKLITKDTEDLVASEKELALVGLVSFVDPLKKTAPAAIRNAEVLGLQIKVLTGDSKDVAAAIALQTGLISTTGEVMTGDELDALPQHEQHEAVLRCSVFARVSPEQKHKIIQLLQEKYEVGFLGEGINDAPALKAANVAIVVQEASDIAREAADIVLLNKSLHVVVEGIKEGRTIFGNTAKYIKATLASNLGNFYTVAISSLFITFLPLLPLQILLINLLTDFPMVSVATDNVDAEELKRPRNYDVKEIALFATVMGIISSLIDFMFFALFYKISPQVLQTNWFIGSVLTELVFVFSIRTKLPIFKASIPSRPLLLLSGLAFVTAIILPFTGIGHTVFGFITPHMQHLWLVLLLTGGYFISTEFVKRLYYRFVDARK